jgi:hypothetical protein
MANSSPGTPRYYIDCGHCTRSVPAPLTVGGEGPPSSGGGLTVNRVAHPANDAIVAVVVPSIEQTHGGELAVSQ